MSDKKVPLLACGQGVNRLDCLPEKNKNHTLAKLNYSYDLLDIHKEACGRSGGNNNNRNVFLAGPGTGGACALGLGAGLGAGLGSTALYDSVSPSGVGRRSPCLEPCRTTAASPNLYAAKPSRHAAGHASGNASGHAAGHASRHDSTSRPCTPISPENCYERYDEPSPLKITRF